MDVGLNMGVDYNDIQTELTNYDRDINTAAYEVKTLLILNPPV